MRSQLTRCFLSACEVLIYCIGWVCTTTNLSRISPLRVLPKTTKFYKSFMNGIRVSSTSSNDWVQTLIFANDGKLLHRAAIILLTPRSTCWQGLTPFSQLRFGTPFAVPISWSPPMTNSQCIAIFTKSCFSMSIHLVEVYRLTIDNT